LGRDAVVQGKEGLEPVELAVAILLDIDPGIGTGDDGADGQTEDVPEVLVTAVFSMRVVEVGETLAKGTESRSRQSSRYGFLFLYRSSTFPA
jgi:hypothetical protein